MRVPWTARRSNQSILKEFSPGCSLETDVEAETPILWPANAGDARDEGSVPALGRSPGGGNGNPLQYSCLKNPMDRGTWQATVHGWGHKESDMTEVTECVHVHIAPSLRLESGHCSSPF